MSSPAASSGALELLEQWLEAVQALMALGDVECLARAQELVDRREAWMRELDASPPPEGVPEELAQRLLEAERGLERRLSGILGALREKLGQVHEARRATEGYRPARARVPAFVSRQV